MDEFSRGFIELLTPTWDYKKFLNETYNAKIAKMAARFVKNQQNRKRFADVLFQVLPSLDANHYATIYMNYRFYGFFLLLLAMIKECPSILDDEDFVGKRYNMRGEKVSMASLIFMAASSCLIYQRDNVRNDWENSFSLFGNEENYTFRYPYSKCQQVFALGKNQLLCGASRALFELIFEVVAEVRSKYLIRQFEQYVFYSLTELSYMYKMQKFYFQQCYSGCYDVLRMHYQIQILALGNILNALSSRITRDYCAAVLSGGDAYQAAAERQQILTELAVLLTRTTEHYMYDVEVSEIEGAETEVGIDSGTGTGASRETRSRKGENADARFLSASLSGSQSQTVREVVYAQDVFKVETFHYFVCALLLPFYQMCREMPRLSSQHGAQFGYNNCCQHSPELTKAIDFAFYAGYFRRADGVQTAERGQELYYYELFKLLAARYDGVVGTESTCCTDIKLLVSVFSDDKYNIPAPQLAAFLADQSAIFDISEYFMLLHQAGRLRSSTIAEFVEEISKLQEANAETYQSCQLDALCYLTVVRTFILITYCIGSQRLVTSSLNPTKLRRFLEYYLSTQHNQLFSSIQCCRVKTYCLTQIVINSYILELDEAAILTTTSGIALLSSFLSADLYGYLSALTRAAIRSTENGKTITAGNIRLLLDSGYFAANRISHLSACLLLVSIFEILDKNVSDCLLPYLFEQSKDIRIAVIDAVGTAALSYDKGYSLIQSLIYRNPNSESDVEDAQAQIVASDMAINFSHSILPFYRQFYDVNCQRPFRFLGQTDFTSEIQTDVVISLMYLLYGVSETDFDNTLFDVPQDCGFYAKDFIRAEFNAACVYAYLSGVFDDLPKVTVLMRSLRSQMTLNAFDYKSLICADLQIFTRYSRLKLSLLQIAENDDAGAQISELQTMFSLLKCNIYAKLDAIHCTRCLFDDYFGVNITLIGTLFVALLSNEINGPALRPTFSIARTSAFYEVSCKIADFGQHNYVDAVLFDKLDVPTMVAIFVLFSDRIYTDSYAISGDAVDSMEKFCCVSEYNNDRAQIDGTMSSRILFYAAAFYAGMRAHIFYKTCESQRQHVIQTFNLFVRLLSDTCQQYALSCYHQKDQLAQILNILFAGFHEFLEDNKMMLMQIDKSLICDCQRKSVYQVILSCIIKLARLYPIDCVVEPSEHIYQELIYFLNKDEQVADDMLNLMLKLRINAQLYANEMAQALKNAVITTENVYNLLQTIIVAKQPFELCVVLLQACYYNKRHYIQQSVYGGVETPKMTFFDKRNIQLMPLPISLILVFRFHPLLQAYANEVIQYIWNTKETFYISKIATQAFMYIATFYQSFYQRAYEAYTSSVFVREMLICIKKALEFIFSAGVLQDDVVSYEFVNLIIEFLSFESVEAYCKYCIYTKISRAAERGKEISIFEGKTQHLNSSAAAEFPEVSQFVLELFNTLVAHFTNFELLLNYAFNCLLPSAMAKVSDRPACQRVVLILQVLFLNSPVTLLELYTELVQTNIVQAYAILLAVTHKSTAGESLLLQYYILQHLDITAAFSPLLGEYEYMQRYKYYIQHYEALNTEIGGTDALAAYLKRYMQRYQVEQFDYRFYQQINRFQHGQIVFVLFGIYTVLLQVLAAKHYFQPFFTTYCLLLSRSRGAPGNAFLLTGGNFSAASMGIQTAAPNLDFSSAFYSVYRCVLDAFSVFLAPNYVRAGAYMQMHTILSQSNPEKAQFSTNAFYLTYMLKRMLFALNSYSIVDLFCFRPGFYVQDSTPKAALQPQFDSEMTHFVREYLRETVRFRQTFYPGEAMSVGLKVLNLCARLVDPDHSFRMGSATLPSYCAERMEQQDSASDEEKTTRSGSPETLSGTFIKRGRNETTVHIYQIAFLLYTTAYVFYQFISPEELQNPASNAAFRLLHYHSQHYPSADVFEALQTIAMALAHTTLAGRDFCYVGFSSVLDNIEILMQARLERAILEKYVCSLLTQVAIACPVRPAIVRIVADLQRLYEMGFTLTIYGEAICCFIQEKDTRVSLQQVAERLAALCGVRREYQEMSAEQIMATLAGFLYLDEVRRVINELK